MFSNSLTPCTIDHSDSKSFKTPSRSAVDIFGVILSVNTDQMIVRGGTGLLACRIDDLGCQCTARFKIECPDSRDKGYCCTDSA